MLNCLNPKWLQTKCRSEKFAKKLVITLAAIQTTSTCQKFGHAFVLIMPKFANFLVGWLGLKPNTPLLSLIQWIEVNLLPSLSEKNRMFPIGFM